MNRKQSIDYLEKEHGLNHIFAQSILVDKKKYINVELDEIIRSFNIQKPKPFVKWVGGKRQLLKQFVKLGLYPPFSFGFNPLKNTYFEPFVGGGAVFLDLLPKKAILSDMNEELVITYNVIKNNVEELIKKLGEHKKKNSKEYFLYIRAQNVNVLSDISRAARFIYLNRTCFNGMYRVNSKGKFNVPYGKYENPKIVDINNLKNISKALQNVEIKYQDYKETLKKAKKGDFIYLDPPYAPLNPTSSFTAYTKDGFAAQQQRELRDMFYELHKRGCFVMLSNSNADFINEIYGELEKKDSKIKIHKVGANRMINSKASGRGKIKEVLVTNY